MTLPDVFHVTDASSGGVLTSVATLARHQAQDPRWGRVTLAFVPREDTPSMPRIRAMVGPDVHIERWSRHQSARRLLDLAKGVRRSLAEDRQRIVHLHSSRAGAVGRLVAVRSRRRVVYSPHAYSFAQPGLPRSAQVIGRAVETVATLLVPGLVLVSESERRIASAAFPWARSAVLANSVVIDATTGGPDARGPAGPADGPLVVAHVGRICPQKDPLLFATVTTRIRRELASVGVEVGVRWLGDGDRHLLGDPAVDVSGWLDTEQLHAALAAVDLLLFTSRGEGMPMAVLEAQARGVVVVGSAVVGVTDLIDPGRTGELGATVDELTRASVRLLLDPSARRERIAAAAERLRARHDVATLSTRAIAAYRESRVLV